MRLIDRLTEYGSSDFYGFHMPGHKRREELGITSFPNPFSVDITEIDGFDNLHHAEGILLQSMERAADIYGADRTYYLVNGSTCGILAALSAAVPEGGKLLMARNSHKSAYHAAFLNRMDVAYVYPEVISGYGISGGISPERVEQALREDRDGKIQAVFLTSPTYEGMVSDVERIADAAHRRGIPLIVDEAHGAHFSFYRGENRKNPENGEKEGGGTERRLFPKSALDCGADAVIQSLHKTLPSLTQTAALHLKGERIDRERLEFYLQVFQSSSPSYVFLASIENCIQYMDGGGRKRLEQFGRRLERWEKTAGEWKCLRLLGDEVLGGGAAVFDRDRSKLVAVVGESARHAGFHGTRLAEEVRARFHLEPEMCCDGYVIFMTSLMDSEEGLSRLLKALSTIDRELWEKSWKRKQENKERENCGNSGGENAYGGPKPERAEAVMTMAEAFQRKGKRVSLESAAGLVSRGFLTVYPPGIPAAVPGERISGKMAKMLLENRRLGLTVEGIDREGNVDTAEMPGMK